jgi:hypothetical protein
LNPSSLLSSAENTFSLLLFKSSKMVSL